MGYLSAYDMASRSSVRESVSWHLASNCYPPVPQEMVSACVDAIEAVADGDSDELIALPKGTLYKGQSMAPAWAVTENFRLEAIIDSLTSEEASQ